VGIDLKSDNKYPEFQIWEEGRQTGIKEVADWITEQAGYHNCVHHGNTYLDFKRYKPWQLN